MTGADARVAFVTGGAGGLGIAIAEALCADGTSVVVADLRREASEAVAGRLEEASGVPCVGVELDVTDPASVARTIDEIAERFGVLHALVNSAGIQIQRPFADLDAADWDRVLAINARGPFLLVQAALRRLWRDQADEASVVNVVSRAYVGGAKDAAYSASKGALASLTLEMALELGPVGVRANGVSPSFVRTAFAEQRTDIAELDAFVGRYEAITPLRRLVTGPDVAQTVAFLASERSRGITGEIIHVTAGSHLPAQP